MSRSCGEKSSRIGTHYGHILYSLLTVLYWSCCLYWQHTPRNPRNRYKTEFLMYFSLIKCIVRCSFACPISCTLIGWLETRASLIKQIRFYTPLLAPIDALCSEGAVSNVKNAQQTRPRLLSFKICTIVSKQ